MLIDVKPLFINLTTLIQYIIIIRMLSPKAVHNVLILFLKEIHKTVSLNQFFANVPFNFTTMLARVVT